MYDARLHPELASDGKLLMSYNVNSLEHDDNLADARLYRPRFVELAWPPAPPGTGVPAAPTGLTVSARDDTADLSWSAVSGATAYRVYQRDVTGGQTHFARQPAPVTGSSRKLGLLIPGHRYEFRVAAVNAVGEGPAGATVTATPQSTRPVAEAVRDANGPGSIQGSYMVRLKDGAAAPERVAEYARQLVEQVGGTLGAVLPWALRGFVATLSEAQAVNLAAHPDVLDVEQDATVELAGVQNDPPWHLDRIDQRDNNLDQKYTYPNDGAVRAYVVDSGIRGTHADFGGRAATGFNAFDGSANTADCPNGHGTRVASALGGATHGAAKGVTLVPVKVFRCLPNGRTDGPASAVARGIDWAIADANAAGHKPAVINLSLTIKRSKTDLNDVEHSVNSALKAGITVVAAAGNHRDDACGYVPSRRGKDTALINVGATNRHDEGWVGTNRGACVDLFAPGEDIDVADVGSDTAVEIVDGTSFAAPQVAGVAAMVLAAHPGYGPADVEKALLDAATDDVLKLIGTGSPNRLLYVERPPTEAPTGLTATATTDGTINLAWTAVSDPGVHYVVSSRDVTADEDDFRRWPSPVFNATTAVARDLDIGHRYEFRVAAANGAGVGPDSNVASAVATLAKPPAPTGLTARANADGTIHLEWDSLGADVWYWVFQRDVTDREGDFTKLPLPITTTSLDAGYLKHNHEYEYKVSGAHRGGEGPPSAPVRATAKYPPPRPPSGLTATAGDGQVTLRWTASPDPDVWYVVHQRDVTLEEEDFTPLPLPITTCCTMTAGYLANGHKYDFVVTATGKGGESVRSAVVRVVPHMPLPGPVTDLAATARPTGGIKLTWTAPGPNVWFDVYQRNVSAGETDFTKLPLPITTCCEFTAGLLKHNSVYEFRMAATNAAGAGPLSAPVRATAHYDPPPAPRNLRGTAAGDAAIVLNWDAPADGLFYWLYYRDVTAREPTLTRAIYPTDKTEHRVTGLRHGHVYEYAISAENAGGEGPKSNTVQVTAYGGLPAPPSGLTAGAGDSQVTLRWTASPSANVLYTIYQRDATNNGSWQQLPLPTGNTSATVGYLANGTTYEFRVAASNGSGQSEPSNVASARPLPPLPKSPSGLTAAPGDGQVTLRWTGSPTPNVYYWIEYRPVGGAWHRLQYPLSTCCAFTVGYLVNGTTYEFRVLATNLAGDSAPTNVAGARPMPPIPAPPSNLRATPGDMEVRLDWAASPSPNVYYWIDYRPAGGTWQRLQYPVSGCCSFTVGYLTNRTTYEFAVRATNLAGDSAPTNVAGARPMPPIPAAPSNLSASRVDNNTALLTWTASPTPRVLYQIQKRNVSRGGGWTTAMFYVEGTSQRVPYLTAGDLYEFRVQAENLSGIGPSSNVTSLRMSYVLASVTCTDYWFPVGGIPVGWTTVEAGAQGVGAYFNARIKVVRKLYWNDQLYATIENNDWTDGVAAWKVGAKSYNLNDGKWDLHVWAYGQSGALWGYAHDQCFGSRW